MEEKMKIWIDADACPAVIKEILFRAAIRESIEMILVANRPLRTPSSPFIKSIQVPKGFDVADARIAEEVREGDLVVTADIPLAAAVIDKRATALSPRGELYDAGNIRERLSMRNFLDELRGAGVQTGGPPALSSADRQAFAGHLDRLLSQGVAR